MPSDSAAIVVASISGVLSLAAAAGVEWSRRQTQKRLQKLSADQNTQLERLKASQAAELERFKDSLARSREVDTKAEQAIRLVAKYRDPLLRAAFDLQSRIYNVYRPGGFTGRGDPEYFRLNTLFVLAEFLGWLEVIRREMQFLDLGAVHETRELGGKLNRVQDLLATTELWRDDCYVYRGQQRAIGELMLTRTQGDVSGERRHECMGYAAFVEAQTDPDFAKWFERLGRAIQRLPDDKPARLIAVQHALVDLIDLLDPDRSRFPESRDHLAVPPSLVDNPDI